MTIFRSFSVGLLGIVLGSLLFSLPMSYEYDAPPFAFPLAVLGFVLFLVSFVVFWLILPGLVLERQWWRAAGYGRRFLQIEGVPAAAFAIWLGLSFALFELLDVYPFAVSEGTNRALEEVLSWTVFGAVFGLMFGLLVFLASLAVRPAHDDPAHE